MIGNILAATLGNLRRNRLHAAVTLIGLSLALTAAILVGLFMRQQYAFERFIPGHERVFRMSGTIAQPGQAVRESAVTPSVLAGALRMRSRDLEAVARLYQDFPVVRARGDAMPVREQGFAWADPDIFKVLPLPAVAGDPATALREPDAVVLTRSVARRHFGRDAPLGATLEVRTPGAAESHRLRVTAVLEDLPPETHLITQIFASGHAAFSPLAMADANPAPMLSGLIFTYARGQPGVTAADLQPALDEIVRPFQAIAAASGTRISAHAVPIAAIRFRPRSDTPNAKPTIDPATIRAIAAVGLLILLMASTSYVALMTARSGRRATEVAVRKACGASRADLIVQFLGESLGFVLLSMIAAMALVELVLPAVNDLLGLSLHFDVLRDPWLIPLLLGVAILVGIAAGLYPALALSAFQPSVALRGGPEGIRGAAWVRQAMVVVQFAILIGLAVATITFYRQTNFALARALSADRGPVLTMAADCSTGFPQAVRELAGVRAATCSSWGALNLGPQGAVTVINRDGQRLTPGFVEVDRYFFKALDLAPVAGRTFSPEHPVDAEQRRVVVNERAARAFGFASPRAAVGQTIALSLEVGAAPVTMPSEIVGVVRDLPASVLAPAGELIYNTHLSGLGVLAIRTDSEDVPQIRRRLEQIWQRMGDGSPLELQLLSQLERERYRGIIIQGIVIAACAVMALVIAVMGLFALSAFMADQRTKEIGVRKAMGAGTRDVVGLLVWQFARPLLLASLIALPLSFLVMRRWLDQFAARVDLPPWLLAAAAAGSTAIALATIAAHVFKVARSKPADALRYE